MVMGKNARRELGRTTRRKYLNAIRHRYQKADKATKKAMLDEYAAISLRVARELDVPLVDMRKAFLKHLRDYNVENLESGILTYDGVHLSDEGNRLVAEQVLKALGERGIK